MSRVWFSGLFVFFYSIRANNFKFKTMKITKGDLINEEYIYLAVIRRKLLISGVV